MFKPNPIAKTTLINSIESALKQGRLEFAAGIVHTFTLLFPYDQDIALWDEYVHKARMAELAFMRYKTQQAFGDETNE